MKPYPILLVIAVLIPVGLSAVNGNLGEKEPASFKHYVEPLFPQILKFDGITEGYIEITIDINADGTIADWLPLRASHPRFVNSIESVISKWTFNPATLNEEPVPAVQKFTFNFTHDGIAIISGNVANVYLNRFAQMMHDDRLVVHLNELDRLPELVKIIRPLIDSRLPVEDQGGSVTITFYIDETGKVRIPYVSDLNCHQNLATSAYETVTKWEFEPPTIKGRPVVVHTRQRFDFTPPGSP